MSFWIFSILLVFWLSSIAIGWSFKRSDYNVSQFLIGGRKIMPSISPNKTYSGLMIGVISLLLFSTLLIFFYDLNNLIFLFSLIIGLISFIGDAIESSFKRFW